MKTLKGYALVLGLVFSAAVGFSATAAEQGEESTGAAEPAVETSEESATDVTAESAQSDRQHQMEHKFEKAQSYYGQCQNVPEGKFEEITPYLKAFTDMEVMAEMMADPVKFAKLMTIVNDPHTMRTMMLCASEPVMWDTWMRGMTDYEKMTRMMVRFMDPGMYMRWMMAPMNPQVWAPMAQFMDPNYYMKWMAAMGNPTFYQPLYSWMDPNWYTPRMQWMMDPQSYAPMFNALNIVSSTDKPAE
jgi:hypothetical protein